MNSMFSFGFYGEEQNCHRNNILWAQPVLIFPLYVFFFLGLPTYFYIYKCFACMSVCVLHVFLVSMEVRRGYQIPWNWNYRILWTTMLELATKSGSFARTTRAPNSWATSSAPWHFVLLLFFKHIILLCSPGYLSFTQFKVGLKLALILLPLQVLGL